MDKIKFTEFKYYQLKLKEFYVDSP